MSHDYQPHWDYPVTEPSAADQAVLDAAVAAVKKDICPVLGIENFSVFCVKPGGLRRGIVGIYVDGTASEPVVGIDIASLKKSSARYGIDWEPQITATLVHELAHAYEEAIGTEFHDEDAVENFARTYVMDGLVDGALLGIEPVAAMENAATTLPDASIYKIRWKNGDFWSKPTGNGDRELEFSSMADALKEGNEVIFVGVSATKAGFVHDQVLPKDVEIVEISPDGAEVAHSLTEARMLSIGVPGQLFGKRTAGRNAP